MWRGNVKRNRFQGLGAASAAIPSAADLEAQVTAIFQKYFGRNPAPAGLQWWVNQVQTGVITDANLALNIVQDAAPADVDYFKKNYPQLAAQVFPTAVPVPGPTPTNAPVVTSTAPVSSTAPAQQIAAQQQAAAQQAASDNTNMLMLGALALGAFFLLKRE